MHIAGISQIKRTLTESFPLADPLCSATSKADAGMVKQGGCHEQGLEHVVCAECTECAGGTAAVRCSGGRGRSRSSASCSLTPQVLFLGVDAA
jgi:hypothetical protein